MSVACGNIIGGRFTENMVDGGLSYGDYPSRAKLS
jgi:hypothetical protein